MDNFPSEKRKSHSKGKGRPVQTYLDDEAFSTFEKVGRELFQDVKNWQAPFLRRIIREWLEAKGKVEKPPPPAAPAWVPGQEQKPGEYPPIEQMNDDTIIWPDKKHMYPPKRGEKPKPERFPEPLEPPKPHHRDK